MEEAPENSPAKRERDYDRYVVCSKCGFVAQYGRSGRQHWAVDPTEEDIGEVAKARLEKFKDMFSDSDEMLESTRTCLKLVCHSTLDIQPPKVEDDGSTNGLQRVNFNLNFDLPVSGTKTPEQIMKLLCGWLKDIAEHPKWLYQHACDHKFGWPEETPIAASE